MFKYEKFDNKIQKEIKKKENKSILQIFFKYFSKNQNFI